MGKKMKLPFIHCSKNLNPKPSASPPWPWPTCGNIRTLSFRASNVYYDDSFRIFNSSSSSSETHSTMSDELDDPIENAIRSLRSSDRLFFEPERSSLLVEKDEENDQGIYKESEILVMDSNNPFEDFRRSMEEMVEAHGLKEWEQVEELLVCYLKINGKKNHGYIVSAFVDLLVTLSFTSSSTKLTNSLTNLTTSSSSLLSTHYSIYSFSSSLTIPSILDNDNNVMDHDDDDHNSHILMG